jgi:thiol-disulfide isomerase/thioredoxin
MVDWQDDWIQYDGRNDMDRRNVLFLSGAIVLIVVLGLPVVWYGGTESNPESTVQWRGEGLPPVDQPDTYRLETFLRLAGKEETRTIRERFRIRVKDSGRLAIGRVRRRVEQSGRTQNDTSNVMAQVDGRRFQVARGGVVQFAGTSDTGHAEAVSRMPGGESYLVSQIVGRNPFLGDSSRRKTSDGYRIRTDSQWVRLDADGVVKRAGGPPSWVHYRFSPYYDVTYSETVTRVDTSSPDFGETIRVSDEVLRMARAETGVRLPNHRFRTLEGEVKRLHEIDGPKLINQWATWCPPCIAEIPHLNEVHERFGQRLTLLGMTNEDTATVQSFLADQRMGYQVLFHSSPMPVPYRRFRSLPFSFLVDGDHRIQAVIRGPRDTEGWTRLIRRHLLSEGS